jgi:transposase
MMGIHEGQKELFAYTVDLERRVRSDHPLRRVLAAVDFTFARELVAHCYGHNGHVSADPAMLLKLMFLLFHDNVRSERELMRILPERIDYLWFLGLGLDDAVPHHSVLSKARARWGREVFEALFVRTVQACVEAGLVDGRTLHVDGSLIDANASRDSVIKADPETISRIKAAYAAVERKLDEDLPPSARSEVNQTLVSTTDPDAPCVSKGKGGGTARPRYKHHRSVDDQCGVITAVETTPGDVPEAERLLPVITQHEANTRKEATHVVADRGYGTVEQYCAVTAEGMSPQMAAFMSSEHTSRGLFPKSDFRYSKEEDAYICPVGQRLKPKRHHKRRQMTDYVADPKICAACSLREQCTRGKKLGRSVARHWKEDELIAAHTEAHTPQAFAARRRRRHLMEGSFAQAANRHHFKRARWRRLWRQQIQDWLIAAVQNIAILGREQGAGVAARRRKPAGPTRAGLLVLTGRTFLDHAD